MQTHMHTATRSIAVLVVLLFAVAGCRTVTGRTAGQWLNDKQITAKVKTAIATAKVGTLTRVDVDTHDGVVYLTGTVDGQQTMNDVLQAARSVPEAQRIVSNLAIARTAQSPPPASPRTEPRRTTQTTVTQQPRTTVTQQPQTAMTPSQTQVAAAPPITGLRFSRMEAESAVGKQRFAAYDDGGKRVATVYIIPAGELRQDAIASLDAGERRIEHVSIYPHPGSDGMQYHVVLWHVDRTEASRLQ